MNAFPATVGSYSPDGRGGQALDTVAVVLPVRDGAKTLGAQLRALSEQTYPAPFPIVIVDDGSRDSTGEVAEQWARTLPNLRILRSPIPRGLSWARNTGAKAVSAEYLAYCDSDDVADPGWLAAMTAGLATSDLVGGHLDLDALNSPRSLAWRSHIPPPTGEPGLPHGEGYLPYAVGANLGVRRSVLTDLGGFDQRLSGHEDVEFCWRAQMASYSLSYAPDAIMQYRLRDTLHGLATQRYHYGTSFAHVYSLYAEHGDLPSASRLAIARQWSQVLMRAPAALRSNSSTGQWVFDASWLVGCAVGSARRHVLCPPG